MPEGQKVASPSSTVPRSIIRTGDGAYVVTARSGDATLGQRVHIELQNPANAAALYTVPAGKTFTGSVVISQTGPAAASLGVSAATGGQLAKITGVGEDIVDVQVAGGAGNAITITAASSPTGVVILDGYTK